MLQSQVQASDRRLLEQKLQPVIINPMTDSSVMAGRTYNHHGQVRTLAPKTKSYPFLDQLEFMIYPGRNFKLEKPGKRLERLEVAVFGDKQSGAIPKRLSKLEDEITSWQIANAQAMEIVNSSKKENQVFNLPKPVKANKAPIVKPYPPPMVMPNPYWSNKNVTAKKVDYDYMNYRMGAPLMQHTAKRLLDLMF
ncbi:MAG: hypothetical protein OXU45_04520 [Candidatus Melainabacteria bacterium]|nr:hypothetical protein [Candidatus Melainabacteria bacterium]